MAEATQFCVGLDNQPGMLGKLCESLTTAGVNIEALCVTEDADCVWVNLVVSPEEAAQQVLGGKDYRFFTEKVIALEIANQPGELGRIAAKLADAGVNISFVYGAGASGSQCKLILKVSDTSAALQALGDTQPRQMMTS